MSFGSDIAGGCCQFAPWGLLTALFMAFMVGVLSWVLLNESHCKHQAIKRGFAEFNPTNRVFQWKEAKP